MIDYETPLCAMPLLFHKVPAELAEVDIQFPTNPVSTLAEVDAQSNPSRSLGASLMNQSPTTKRNGAGSFDSNFGPQRGPHGVLITHQSRTAKFR